MKIRQSASCQFLRAETGASLAEYAILLSLIAALSIGAMIAIGGNVSGVLDSANDSIVDTGTGSEGGSGGEPGQPFSFAVTIDGQANANKAIGPGQSATLAWNIENGAWPEEWRSIGGACIARGNEGEEDNGEGGLGSDDVPASGASSGSQTFNWSGDLVGCVYEACFAAGDPNDEEVWEEKCAKIAFVGTAVDPNPVLSMKVNGVSYATIAMGGSATFTWTNTMPFEGDVSMSASGSFCNTASVPASFSTSGTYTASFANFSGCAVTMCASGTTFPDESGTYKCAGAIFPAGDGIPELSFGTKSGLTPNTPTSSDAATVSGINIPVTLSASGAQVSVNGGAPVSGAFTVNNGDSIVLTTNSATGAGGSKQITVSKTGFTTRWLLLNTGADEDPTMGNFTAVSGALPRSPVASNQVTPSGYAAMNFTVDNGTASIYSSGGTLRHGPTSSGSIVSGEKITLSALSGVGPGEVVTVTLHFGNGLTQTRVWTVTNKSPFNDATPDAMSFSTDTEVSSEAILVTSPVVASGFDAAQTFSFPGEVCVNGSCSSGSASVSPGDSVVLRAAAPEDCGSESWTFSTISGAWNMCPVPAEDEEQKLALGYCPPASFDENYGDKSLGWGAPGQYYWHNDVDEFPEGGGMRYSNQTFAYVCEGGEWQQESFGFCSIGGSNQSTPPYAQRKSQCASDRSPMPGIGYGCSNPNIPSWQVWDCFVNAAS